MAVSSSQLSEEQEELVEEFADSQFVSLTFSDEGTEQKLEAEYKINGPRRQEDGSVVISDTHRVAICFPDGYPSIPPICTFLTPIFHPDVNHSTIEINEFWTESKTMSELIIHIGRMISGQHFGLDSTSNPEAADWYSANSEKLPFDLINFNDEEDDKNEIEIEIEIEDAGEVEENEPVDSNIVGSNILGSEEHDFCPLSEEDEAERYKELAAQYEAEVGAKKKKTLIVGGASISGLVISAVVYLLIMDVANYKSAASAWQEADTLFSEKKYKAVEKKGNTALELLGKIRFLKKTEKQSLEKDIKGVFSTAEFQGGIAGKALYEGKYIKKEAIAQIETVKKLCQRGEASATAEDWDDALSAYEEALELVKKSKEFQADYIEQINQAALKAKFNSFLKNGNQFFDKGELDDAISNFQQASEIANSNIGLDKEKVALIHSSLDKALLRKFVQEGEGAFTALELGKALSSFENALVLAEKETVTEIDYADSIKHYIRKVRLYQLLEKGKTAFVTRSWDAAVNFFEDALHFLLEGNTAKEEIRSHEVAIRKKILQAKVWRDQEKAAANKAKNNLEESLQLQQNIRKMISESPFSGNEEFQNTLNKAEVEVSSLITQIDIRQKITYLVANYQDIFRSNHFLAKSASMLGPVSIVFVEKQENVQVFNMKCTGYTGSGKVALELNYQYDLDRKKWSMAGKG